MIGQLKRFVVGQPLATEQLAHERLSKRIALAVLSSDALSSVAYATEAVLIATPARDATSTIVTARFLVVPIFLWLERRYVSAFCGAK